MAENNTDEVPGNNVKLNVDSTKDENNNIGDEVKDSPNKIRRVRALRRTKATDGTTNDDVVCRRKFGVVQISFRCSTSDYSSDENVYEAQSIEFINYNTTICHVKTGRIKETYHINVSSK